MLLTTVVLTEDQQNAYDKMVEFILSPTDNVFVLTGYAGTGKSTLISKLKENFSSLIATKKLISGVTHEREELALNFTATTNKAAEALASIVDEEVTTVHSFLQIRIKKDYQTNKSELNTTNVKECAPMVLVVDEASYIDNQLLDVIMSVTAKVKVIFVGDASQLTPVSHKHSPVFARNWPSAKLEKVVRQADGNPIIELSQSFRNVVNGGDFFSFVPDGKAIHHLNDVDFQTAIQGEFSRDTWTQKDSKILAWTNKTVIAYNETVNKVISGSSAFSAGDYAICNEYFPRRTGRDLKTGESVLIHQVAPATEHGVEGYHITLSDRYTHFMPKNITDKQKRVSQARKTKALSIIEDINKNWIDLRAAYACTINKAQGSTYDAVFIDLDDVSRCRNPNQLARMLYVAVSRAAKTIYFKGDIV